MIGLKKGASDEDGLATPETTSTTGISNDVTKSGISSLTHRTTTAPKSASKTVAREGGRRSARNAPLSVSKRTAGIDSMRPSERRSVSEISSGLRAMRR